MIASTAAKIHPTDSRIGTTGAMIDLTGVIPPISYSFGRSADLEPAFPRASLSQAGGKPALHAAGLSCGL